MALVKINNILRHFDTDKLEIKNVSNGRWEVSYDRADFIVVGGRKAGGARNEWWVYNPEFYGENYVPCKSMVAALKLGIAY